MSPCLNRTLAALDPRANLSMTLGVRDEVESPISNSSLSLRACIKSGPMVRNRNDELPLSISPDHLSSPARVLLSFSGAILFVHATVDSLVGGEVQNWFTNRFDFS
jgi:hypothetical protein